MQGIKRYYRKITPRTRFIIVYFLIMGLGASIFTRLANSLNLLLLVPAELILAVLAYREDSVRRDLPTLFGCAAILWGLIAATLNGGILTESRATTYWCVAAAWFFMLRQSNRANAETVREEFTAVSATLLISYLPFVLIALVSLFSGRTFHLPGDSEAGIGIDVAGVLNTRFRVLENPNVCGRMEVVSILMAIYLFLTKKKTGWRVFSVAAMIVNFMALTHTQSRACIMALCVAVGILVFRAVYVLIRRRGLRVAAGLAACVLTFFLVLTGSNLLYKADIVIASHTATISKADIPIDSRVETDGQFDVLGTGRGNVWRMTLSYLKAHPKALAVGMNSNNIMKEIDGGAGVLLTEVHVHNSLLECVVMNGVPFLLIILAFLVCMVPKCWRVLTGRCANAEFVFVAIIVALLAMSMTEVMLFTRLKVANSLFMLVCGYVLLYCRDAKRT